MGETNDNNPNDAPTFREMKHKYDGRDNISVDGRTLHLVKVSKLPALNFEPHVTGWDRARDEDVRYTLEEFRDAVEN